MAIAWINSASAEATTITIPSGYRVGDLMVIFAFRDGSTTNPSIPTGWTTITNTTDGTLCSLSIGYKRCTSTSETSGTWTNATALVCSIYSGAITSASPFGAVAAGSGATNTVNYAARALASSGVTGSSWFLGFAGHTSVDTTIETAPSGMTMRTNTAGATAEVAGFDTNGLATGNWPSTNVSVSGTASNWQTVVIELKAQPNTLENYKSFKGGNGLSFTERIR
jgi:hypothetical protein